MTYLESFTALNFSGRYAVMADFDKRNRMYLNPRVSFHVNSNHPALAKYMSPWIEKINGNNRFFGYANYKSFSELFDKLTLGNIARL